MELYALFHSWLPLLNSTLSITYTWVPIVCLMSLSSNVLKHMYTDSVFFWVWNNIVHITKEVEHFLIFGGHLDIIFYELFTQFSSFPQISLLLSYFPFFFSLVILDKSVRIKTQNTYAFPVMWKERLQHEEWLDSRYRFLSGQVKTEMKTLRHCGGSILQEAAASKWNQEWCYKNQKLVEGWVELKSGAQDCCLSASIGSLRDCKSTSVNVGDDCCKNTLALLSCTCGLRLVLPDARLRTEGWSPFHLHP